MTVNLQRRSLSGTWKRAQTPPPISRPRRATARQRGAWKRY